MASKPAKDVAKAAPARRGETPKAPDRADHPIYARDEIATPSLPTSPRLIAWSAS